MTAARLGWSFDGAFRLTDDLGSTHVLTTMALQMIQDLLREGVQRLHQREAADLHREEGFKGQRACTDVVRHVLRSN